VAKSHLEGKMSYPGHFVIGWPCPALSNLSLAGHVLFSDRYYWLRIWWQSNRMFQKL